jgi:transposase
MAAHVRTVAIPEVDRRELQRRARSKGAPARKVERARIVLLAADAVPGKQIAARVGCAEPTVVTWRRRYAEQGLPGLDDHPRPGTPSPLPDALRDRVLEGTLTEPPIQFGATHCSSRLLAAEGTPISHATIARIWHRFGVQPWRAETFKFSTHPAARGQDPRRRGAPPAPAGHGGGAVRGREAAGAGPGADRPDVAGAARIGGAADLRLPPARHHHAVRRPGGGHRQG